MIFKRKKDYTLSSMIIDQDTKIIEQWQNLCFESLDKINKAIEYIKNATEEAHFENDKLIDVLDILKGVEKD